MRMLRMIRRTFAGLMCLFSVSTFSCGNAVPTNDVNFCASFKKVATCYCTSSGLPAGMCQDMNMLYARMVSVYGSLDKACAAQPYTTKQDCLDNWNCYRLGGVDSRGNYSSNKTMSVTYI